MEMSHLQGQENSFEQEIALFSEHDSATGVYPRPDLIALAQYLKTSANYNKDQSSGQSRDLAELNILSKFVVVHSPRTATHITFGSTPSEMAKYLDFDNSQTPNITFLRGNATSMWLKTIGKKQRLSPELYRRHLHEAFTKGSSHEYYSSPSLPSSSPRVFQLTISTICLRGTAGDSHEPEDLQEARRSGAEAMNKYLQDLRHGGRVADSVVRKFLLFSRQEIVMEQTITVEVSPPNAAWQAVVWLDNGRDLSQSTTGPWTPKPHTKAWETYILPVIVHNTPDTSKRPREGLGQSTSSLNLRTLNRTTQLEPSPVTEWKADQNLCLLPFQYGTRLNKEIASKDALYSLSELFDFAASSELQFLNLLQHRIEIELSIIGDENLGKQTETALLNLKYAKTQLSVHAQRLDETVTMLENHHTFGWPEAPESPVAVQAARSLLIDFEHLRRRAKALTEECEQGMTTLANSSILEESRRMTDNAERVRKLTILATTFIPLTFTCSLYGMNFVEMGTGILSVWVWFATAVPLSLLAFSVYYFGSIVAAFSLLLDRIRRST